MANLALDPEVLVIEIKRLERRCRRLERMGAAVIVLLGLGFVLAAGHAGPRTLEAQEIILRDAAGRVTARLGSVQQGLFAGTGLMLYDADQKVRALLAASKDAPVLVLNDSSGRHGVSLGTWADGPALSLYGKNDKKLVWLGVSRQVIPMLSLQDAVETTRAEVAVTDEKGPLLSFYDSKGGVVYRKP
jgi:hypothetical protein